MRWSTQGKLARRRSIAVKVGALIQAVAHHARDLILDLLDRARPSNVFQKLTRVPMCYSALQAAFDDRQPEGDRRAGSYLVSPSPYASTRPPETSRQMTEMQNNGSRCFPRLIRFRKSHPSDHWTCSWLPQDALRSWRLPSYSSQVLRRW